MLTRSWRSCLERRRWSKWCTTYKFSCSFVAITARYAYNWCAKNFRACTREDRWTLFYAQTGRTTLITPWSGIECCKLYKHSSIVKKKNNIDVYIFFFFSKIRSKLNLLKNCRIRRIYYSFFRNLKHTFKTFFDDFKFL